MKEKKLQKFKEKTKEKNKFIFFFFFFLEKPAQKGYLIK